MQELFWNGSRLRRSLTRTLTRSAHWIGVASCMMIAIITFSLQSTIASPSNPISSQISPSQPRLGDTLSIVVSDPTGQTPQLQFDGKSYATYPIGNHRFRALLPTTPLDRPGPKRIQVQSGSTRQTLSFQLRNRSFPTQRIWLPEGQDGNVSDWEFNQVDAFKRIVTPEKFWQGAFLRPNNGEITSIYGVRRYYNGVFADDYFHRGVDYAGDVGSKVISPASGRVSFIGYEKEGYQVHGNIVGIDHGQGVAGIFMHLNRIQVKRGEFVKAGQTIGTLGDTGAATGPHLHWGVYVNGQSVDPVPWREDGFE